MPIDDDWHARDMGREVRMMMMMMMLLVSRRTDSAVRKQVLGEQNVAIYRVHHHGFSVLVLELYKQKSCDRDTWRRCGFGEAGARARSSTAKSAEMHTRHAERGLIQ
jgi:hypothetical protein